MVLGSPSTKNQLFYFGLQYIERIHTKQPFGAQHFHHVGHRVVEQRHFFVVSYRHFSSSVGEESAVFERTHRADPWFAGAVDEAAVDPAAHSI